MKCRTLHARPSLGARLDNLLDSRFLPKSWVGRVWSSSELPSRLRHCAQHLMKGTEWRAYRDGDHLLFAIARQHLEEFKDDRSTTMDVYFLDSHAVVYAAAVWAHSESTGWWLNSVLDLSYDCERGWWLDCVIEPSAPVSAESAGSATGVLEMTHLAVPSSTERQVVGTKAARFYKKHI